MYGLAWITFFMSRVRQAIRQRYSRVTKSQPKTIAVLSHVFVYVSLAIVYLEELGEEIAKYNEPNTSNVIL